MTPSTFIARILGPLLVISGIGLLLEGQAFSAMAGDFLRNPALIYFSGLITLAVGLAILNVHHLWVRDWRVIVTIFGWLTLLGGILRILATSWVQRAAESVIAHPRWLVVGAVATLVLGGFLTVMGYQEVWNSGRRRPSHRVSAARSSGSASRSAKRPRRKAGETRSGHSS
jgi:positive regulator of sigma E activity